jgi:cobalt-precorrin 5A hydrolase
MKLAVIALTKGGAQLGQRIALAYPEQVDLYLNPLNQPLKQLTERLFPQYQGIVFIMALGIVVRTIAPFLQDKRKDPAVVCLDEAGSFVISVASGHLGGANKLTIQLAELLSAAPVITTATDVQGKIAFDVLAVEQDLLIEPFENLRLLNSALVNGEKIGLISQIPAEKLGYQKDNPRWAGITFNPWTEKWPEQLATNGHYQYPFMVIITNQEQPIPAIKPEPVILHLRPKNLIAGIGCRKGVKAEVIISAIKDALNQAGRSALSLCKLTSVDIKQAEPGLLEAALKLGLPIKFYPALELDQYLEKHTELSQSEYVKTQIGVGGVCEPAAMLAGHQTTLVLSKRKYQGVTVALAEEKLS